VTVTVVRFYLPFVGSFGDEPELVFCQFVGHAYPVRGPPVA
jgi:hypothetical protein